MKASDWIAALGVLGTWAIAAMALWGDWFRSRFSILRPVLTIEPIGLSEIVPQNNGMKARYYHLRVRNVRGRLRSTRGSGLNHSRRKRGRGRTTDNRVW